MVLWRNIVMNEKTDKELFDPPNGLLYVGPEDPRCIKRDKKVKQIDMKGALEYARRARAEGREVTMEEMEQFVELEEE